MMENITFEQAMKRLNEITEKLQNASSSLDEGLKLFEEGITLSRFCQQQLKGYEEKLAQLSAQEENHD